jgi:hypothetical protein
MEKYKLVILGHFDTDYEVSVATESNTMASKSWGWFGLNKILISEGNHITKDKWDEIINIANSILNGLNAPIV